MALGQWLSTDYPLLVFALGRIQVTGHTVDDTIKTYVLHKMNIIILSVYHQEQSIRLVNYVILKVKFQNRFPRSNGQS